MSKRVPPPLPPRQPSTTESLHIASNAPPPYSSITAHPSTSTGIPWTTRDPRSTSQESLTPSTSSPQRSRRKLLLIFIHGFMGNETSFQSFPAHVHHLVTVLLAETHVVHTKVYPRYRSKRAITFARDDFSKWLEPHEDPSTDVVLCGHSMGGLLSAEVVLMPAEAQGNALKHRILGSINFDVPFLGMHPGVVKAGLASIFAPGQDPKMEAQAHASSNPTSDGLTSPTASTPSLNRADTFWNSQNPDANFNPAFPNDVALPVRKGWRSAYHFISKHGADGFADLTRATKQLVSSHLEFGGAMADYAGLKTRYARVRALEDESGIVRGSVVGGARVERVRFINYYTVSTGRVKKVEAASLSRELGSGSEGEGPASALLTADEADEASAGLDLSRMSTQTDTEREDWESAAETLTIGGDSNTTMSHAEPTPISDSEPETTPPVPEHPPPAIPLTATSSVSALPPIPDLPPAPAPLDTSFITDPATRKLVTKEHARAVKRYEKDVKDREKAIAERKKLEAKLARKEGKGKGKEAKGKGKKVEAEMTHSEREELRLRTERERMEAEGRRMRGEPELAVRTEGDSSDSDAGPASATTASTHTRSLHRTKTRTPSPPPPKPKGPPKDRTFCMLPPKDSHGQRDPCWVRVFMENVDEVGAHCGLFFVDERYERLVGEVAERIEGWVAQSSYGDAA